MRSARSPVTNRVYSLQPQTPSYSISPMVPGFQTACDAMKGKIKQRLAAIEGQEVDGGDSASSYLIDIDAAVAYSR